VKSDEKIRREPGFARGDQAANGDGVRAAAGVAVAAAAAPDGRRSGRIDRRQLGPTSAPEATTAVADFDAAQRSRAFAGSTEPVLAAQPELQPPITHSRKQSTCPFQERRQEAERAARRRSTVREKVSFMTSAQSETTAPVVHSKAEPAPADATSRDGFPSPTARPPQPRKWLVPRRAAAASRSDPFKTNRPAKPGGFLSPQVDRQPVVTASPRRSIDLLVEIANSLSWSSSPLPPRHHHAGNAIAAKVGERPAFVMNLVDAEHDGHAGTRRGFDDGSVAAA